MSIVYHGTTITDYNPINYVKNGVTTVLRKVIYRKGGVDTVVYNNTNAAAISTSYASASGGTTLNYAVGTPNSATVSSCVAHSGNDYRIQNKTLGTYTNEYTGNQAFGYTTLSGGSTYFDGVIYQSQATAEAAAKRQILNTATKTSTYTAYSYFNYSITVRANINYAPSNTLTVKIYVNNNLVHTGDVSTQTQIVTYTYKDYPTLTNRNAIIPLKVEICHGDTVLGTATGTCASTMTITYGDE